MNTDDLDFEPVQPAKAPMTPEQSRLIAAYDKHPTPRPEPDRAPDGRYRLRHPDSGKIRNFTRVTTLAGTIDDRYNLERWAQGYVALGVATNLPVREKILALEDPRDSDKGHLQSLAAEAKDLAGGSVAASVGTAIHAFTEHWDLGTGVVAPAPYDADVLAYAEALKAAGITAPAEYVERVVINPDHDTAGTWDRLVIMDDGTARILDVKTGASLDHGWTSIAAQLAEYAAATHMLMDDGSWETTPTIDQTTALVAHVPAGEGICTLHEVDIEKGAEVAALCFLIRSTRSRMKRKGYLSSQMERLEQLEPELTVSSATCTWPEATDEQIIQAGKRYKEDAIGDAITELRAAWTATGISRKPPWTFAERQILLDLFYPSYDGTETDPVLEEKAATKLQAQAERLDSHDTPPRPSLPDPPDDNTEGDLGTTRERLTRLKDTDPKAADILAIWIRDAKTHGRPLNGQPFTARKEAAVSTALAVLYQIHPVKTTRGRTAAPSIHSLMSYLIDYVTGRDLAAHYPTGALLGSLTTDEALAVTYALDGWDSESLTKSVVAAAALDAPVEVSTPNQQKAGEQ